MINENQLWNNQNLIEIIAMKGSGQEWTLKLAIVIKIVEIIQMSKTGIHIHKSYRTQPVIQYNTIQTHIIISTIMCCMSLSKNMCYA